MILKNKKFLQLLQLMHVEPTTEIEKGMLEQLHVKKASLSIEVHLYFLSVIDVDTLNFLIERIRQYFSDTLQYQSVIVRIRYESSSISTEMLEKYFTYCVNELGTLKSRYNTFESFNKTFTDDTVTIFVATDDEKAMLLELTGEIEKLFKQYGLKQSITVNVSSFETPISTIIQENIRSIDLEAQREQQTYDKLSKGNEQQTNGKSKFQRPPRAKSNINREPTSLKLIPASETDLIEYYQRTNKKEFVIVADIISSTVTEKYRRDADRSKFKIYEALVSDGEDSITIKTFVNMNIEGNEAFYEEKAVAGKRIRAYGYATFDKFANDVVFMIEELLIEGDSERKEIVDFAPVRRVELHAHTKMTAQDSVMDVDDYVKQAVKFKHRALAVTDMHNVHVFPDFYNATKDLDILPIFGVEGLLVDENQFQIAFEDGDFDLRDATYVVYDLETTGLSSQYNEIIEIAAAKVKHGMIVDEFSSYVKPKRPINEFITELTSITNDDVRMAEPIEIVLPRFQAFIENTVLVAHNASFDNAHLYQNLKNLNRYNGLIPTIDTMQLAKVRYGHKLKKFNLKAVAKFFDVELEQHHRAIYDAKTTAYIFIKMLNELLDSNVYYYRQINELIDERDVYELTYPTHFTILSRNPIGKKNLYKIISDSHTVHFAKEPIVSKRFLQAHREGLLIGSGCINGEIFKLAYERSQEELEKAMHFYDFIEVQPPSVYEILVEKNRDINVRDFIKDTIKRIIETAQSLQKIVVATGDVHHLTKEDLKLREIYINAPKLGGGIHDLADIERVPSMHFMTTNEMLEAFHFLGDELAYEIVVTNTNAIADQIERYPLFPDQLFAPKDDFLSDRGVLSFKDSVRDMTLSNAYARYGNPLPKYIDDRIQKELTSIIGNNFASIYYISYMLVKHSVDAGYIVGSRGSVGSSLVANLMNITEVNPLPPHYFCTSCHFTAIKYSEEEKKIYPRQSKELNLEVRLNRADTGYDLEETRCPVCGAMLSQDGVDIPFETFLGFKGEKVPDIDLNFSGEYQSKAHEFCRDMFGVDHAFRAGTISTIAEKTAYGYIKKYFEKKNIQVRNAEINRIIQKISGAKRSTGQHPGGIVVLPKEIEYTDVIPIQYPADDVNASWRTTHFDYHKFESNLLKLDILGHDDPTMIRHLMDFVHRYPDEFPFSEVEEIPLTDKEVFKLFNGLSSLHITVEKMAGESIGTTGLPEFGTKLTKDMLSEIQPTSISDLLKVSGLSHGTNVWNGNSRDFMQGIKEGYPRVPFKELIGCRDDIMVYLLAKGLPASDAFKIMESVRKGKGISKDFEKEMLSYQIPKWYIESCKLIKYMFPKAHATAYVIMALRIGWFKVHRPIFYYAGYFSRRADAFDVVAMTRGYEAIRVKVLQLGEKIENKSASTKEIDTHYSLLLALEMTARGFSFKQMDIRTSDATNFMVSDDRKSLLIPFNAMDSLGEATALSITEARLEMMFTSKRDVARRTKINTTLFEKMNALGVFEGLPEDDQMGLF